jgi:hypothetical protein
MYAGQIYYPAVPNVVVGDAHKALMVVNATDPVKRFAEGSRDFGAVLTGLLKDLGSARRGFYGAALSAFIVGAAMGVELVNWRPFWLGIDRDEGFELEHGEGAFSGGGAHGNVLEEVGLVVAMHGDRRSLDSTSDSELHTQRAAPLRMHLATAAAGAPV